MDVLLHSAYNEQARIAVLKQCTKYFQAAQTIADATLNPNTAHIEATWKQIPKLPQPQCTWSSTCSQAGANTSIGCQGSVCVTPTTDTSQCWSGGAYCIWTVPPGARIARFQLWGPGGASLGGQCCAFAPYGTSGAYGSVIIPVTPGDVYCMCAGQAAPVCGYCGCMCSCCGFVDGVGCPSWIVGPGLYNVCALGGNSKASEGMKARACSYGCLNFIGNNCHCCYFNNLRLPSGATTVTHGAIISNCGWCISQSNGCAACGMILPQADWERGTCGCAEYGVLYRVPTIHQGFDFDSNVCGAATITLVPVDVEGYSNTCRLLNNWSFTTTCTARCMPNMWCVNCTMCRPGLGGSFGVWTSGCTGDCSYGDRGRGGSVVVQWM